MQNEFQPEQNQTPLVTKPAAPLAVETEADAQAVADITKRLNEITRRANKVSHWFKVGIYAIVPCFLLGFWPIAFFFRANNLLRQMLMFSCLGAMYAAIALAFWMRSKTTPKFDANEVARLGGVKAIVPLFAAVPTTMFMKQQDTIYSALTALLPRMNVSDAYLITPAIRRTIHGWFEFSCTNSSLKTLTVNRDIAALKALEQVGDAKDVAIVERLAIMKALTPEQEKVKQAAIECLPMLRANCGEVETARTLLRASHAAAARPDTLLRPASGAGQTAAQELLRPSDANET